MKKGQISVIYLGILVLISMFLFGSIFIWSNSLTDNAILEFNELQTESLLSKFEQRLTYMKFVTNTTNATVSNATLTVLIPYKIGEQDYFVRGDHNDLIIQMSGRGVSQGTKTIFRRRIYWWDTNFNGGSHSSNGKVNFFFNTSTGNVTIF